MSAPRDNSEARTTGPSRGAEHVPTRASAAGEAAGQLIGRYKLLEELGEGGMGTVWMAQQSEPVKRRVALKIIKLGMDTREVVARFEVERQALALMDHPHIAKVLDAGATDSGRPYFVMELVRGVPITEYCDQAKLGLQERLELFTQVCHAIQHAHHKGIIHRDVKPSNVLVSLQDGKPLPKVIDFGIAKATSAELTHQTLHTKLSQVIGTPEYMAPEQAESGGLDIDTRADIYSLGVLLYELLTGTKPFDIQQAITAGYEEMLRVIREDDPAKPSTRIGSLGDTATDIAVKRRVDTTALNKNLKGDLDWIVMKALEKDRTRRYETANGFAFDIANYLNDEPVDAAPPSARYRLGKLLRRRKKTVLSAALIALLLIAGSVGTGIGWWKTTKANRLLDTALDQKDEALAQEAEQRKLAEDNEQRARSAETQALAEAERATKAEAATQARADELEQVAAFQAEQLSELDVELMGARLRRALIEAAPEAQQTALSQNLAGVNFTSLSLDTLRENLFKRTLDAIGKQFALQPLVQAQLLQTTASTWRELGLLEIALDPQVRALSIRRRVLGDEHPDTLTSIHYLGFLLDSQGKLSEAEALYREAVNAKRRVLGDAHLSTLASISNLGNLLRSQGKLSEAEPYILEALEGSRRVLGDEHLDTLISISSLGFLLEDQGKLLEAEPYYRQALEGRRRVLGDEHPSTLTSINNLGMLLQSQGKLSEAEPYMREALEGRRRVQGDEHPETLRSINNLGMLLQSQGKLSEAEPYVREALEGRRRVLGNEHPGTLASINNLGILLRSQGNLSVAEPYYREALEGKRRVLGDEHPNTLISINNLGFLLQSQGKLSEAEPYMQEALEGCRRVLGDEHPNTLTMINNLGLLLEAQGKPSKAEPYYREALEGRRRVLGDEHPDTLASINTLGGFLGARVKAAREEGVELRIGEALMKHGEHLINQGIFSDAEDMLTEALDLLFAEAPTGDPRPWQTQASLGVALAEQGQHGDAESMLLEAAQALQEQHTAASPGDPKLIATGRVFQQVVEFYAARHASQPGKGHDAQAAKWQAKLDAWRLKHELGETK